jgi:hypothetical protein
MSSSIPQTENINERRAKLAQEALEKRNSARAVAMRHHQKHAKKPKNNGNEIRVASISTENEKQKFKLPGFKIRKNAMRSSSNCEDDEEMWPWYIIFTLLVVAVIMVIVYAVKGSSKNSVVPVRIVDQKPQYLFGGQKQIQKQIQASVASEDSVESMDSDTTMDSTESMEIGGGDSIISVSTAGSSYMSDNSLSGGNISFDRSAALSDAMIAMPSVPFKFEK